MNRRARFCCVLLALLSTAKAQDSRPYFGVGGAYFAGAVTPVYSFQVGRSISDLLEVRATLDTLGSVSVVGAELLVALYPDSALKAYFGLGPDLLVFLAAPPAGSSFEVHGTAGAEFRLGGNPGIGLYIEAKPFLVSTLRLGTLASAFRAGVNVYF